MRKTIPLLLLCLLPHAMKAQSQMADTLFVSDLFTTHVIFPTELIYAHCSNDDQIGRKIIPESRNMVALKAYEPFDTPMSMSALESNGQLHTFIIAYREQPESLVCDLRNVKPEPSGESGGRRSAGKAARARKTGSHPQGSQALYRMADAPELRDVLAAQQRLFHISSRQYALQVTCTNIVTYSDITYMVFSLRNSSGVSYDCPDATFVVESRRNTRKTVSYDRNIFPKGRLGSLSCAPSASTSIGYSFDKMSLSKDQVLRVYFYEQGGQRELVLTVSADDINRARNTL